MELQVLLLLPDLPLSGAATRTVHLAEQLVDHGCAVKIVVFASPVDTGLEARLSLSGIDTLRVQSPSGLWRLVGMARGEPDTVIHAAMPTAGLAAVMLGRLTGRPVVYSYTNCLHDQRPFRTSSFMDHAKAIAERVIANRADALHTVSLGVAAQASEKYEGTEGRLHALTHAATLPLAEGRITDGADLIDRLSDAHPKLLCVGRLLPHKRFADAVHAVAVLRQHWPRIQLLIAGSGPERDSIINLIAKLELGNNVTLLGESRLLRPVFLWADILVHPSLYEGFPRVVAEARAHMLPVVTVNTPYGREAAQMYDLVALARPVDSAALAEVIMTSMSAKARTMATIEDAESIGARMLDVYAGVLGRRWRNA